ncbi:TPA: hypothetical protein JZF62_004645 [Escherichia coli]|nr:hypothetical protein [Escherichia coli]
MLGGADNPNGELPSYITGANNRTAKQYITLLYLRIFRIKRHKKSIT